MAKINDGNFYYAVSFHSFASAMTEIDYKQRILVKSGELFMQYGVRSISMDDIAFSLGISKKTIYQYFSDKDELVGAVILAKLSENEQICSVDRRQAENAIDELFKAMEMAEQMLRTLNPSVMFDLRKYHPNAYGLIEKHKNEFLFNIIRSNLEWGIEEGLYRPELNINIITHLRIKTMLLAFDPAFFSEQKSSIVDIEQQILEHYLFGIVTLKGYELVLQYQHKRQKT
jgi:AcrR family transcriptional regulator